MQRLLLAYDVFCFAFSVVLCAGSAVWAGYHRYADLGGENFWMLVAILMAVLGKDVASKRGWDKPNAN